MDSKKPWQSKTMLLNGLAGLAMFVALFIPQAEQVKVFIEHNAAQIGMIWGILNMVLRQVTKDKIVLKD